MRVIAGCGRDAERTASDCERLALEFGHPVAAFVDLGQLLRVTAIDALIVAAPPDAHLPALRVALDHGVHVLCEKPLVPLGESEAVAAICDGFRSAELALVENCQWPLVLADFDRLHPGRSGSPSTFELGLSPAFAGQAMLEDSASHFVSLAQALMPLRGDATVRILAAPADLDSRTSADFEVEFTSAGATLRGRLELRRVREQPRPAHLVIDGARVDRSIRLPGYELWWRSPDGREERGDDPMESLVYGFVELIRERSLDRIRAESERVRTRARLYRGILEACR